MRGLIIRFASIYRTAAPVTMLAHIRRSSSAIRVTSCSFYQAVQLFALTRGDIGRARVLPRSGAACTKLRVSQRRSCKFSRCSSVVSAGLRAQLYRGVFFGAGVITSVGKRKRSSVSLCLPGVGTYLITTFVSGTCTSVLYYFFFFFLVVS